MLLKNLFTGFFSLSLRSLGGDFRKGCVLSGSMTKSRLLPIRFKAPLNVTGFPIHWLILYTICLTSCGIFETRTPEEPGTTTLPGFIQPVQPRNVIENLENAVRFLTLDYYIRCLSTEEFVFEPSFEAQVDYPDIWQGWGLEQEEQYFNNLRSEGRGLAGHNLKFEGESYVGDDSEQVFEASYTLKVEHNRSKEVPREAKGKLRMVLKSDPEGRWTIHSWSDSGEGSEFTWSDFKAIFL